MKPMAAPIAMTVSHRPTTAPLPGSPSLKGLLRVRVRVRVMIRVRLGVRVGPAHF